MFGWLSSFVDFVVLVKGLQRMFWGVVLLVFL